ncbi:MAG: acetate/propionate family kinase [Deltaproteobacteria bacterium]|nr:MAG: acetate/propionate family kinase [Deltaproteobacteria bacterium]
MQCLIINCGSSSIKAAIVDHETGRPTADLSIERIGQAESVLRLTGDGEARPCPGGDHEEALRHGLPLLLARLPGGSKIGGVGHRVVHGGARFSAPTRIDDAVEQAIESLVPLAPLHNPGNLAGIRAARALLPDAVHVAVFDTAFHSTLPPRARAYALPTELSEKHGIQRYGFHGTSHAYVADRAAEFLGEDLENLRLITCHLGNGSSVTAVEYGRSVETSMGMTPLEGLVMGTRSGDVDPGVLLHLMRAEKLDADGLDRLLNRQSGLAGLSGVGNDLRDIEERAANGDERCRLALHVFVHRVRKYIGAYCAVMGRVDAIVFTAGIGEHSQLVRHHICQRLDFLGARLDDERNRAATVDQDTPTVEISQPHSRTHLLVVATDEQHAIAQQTAAVVLGHDQVKGERPIPVAISARHIHLTPTAIETLFGPGHTLTARSDLSQPGQFACQEQVDVVGPKRTIEGVRVLGPPRSNTQVEISRTDEFHLGIDAPVRDSGDVSGSAGVTLVGPAGTLVLEEGAICARRHIHMPPDDAEHYGVENRDVVEVAIDSEGRDLIFGDVLIRVSPSYALEMHIDTDEANAAELSPGAEGLLAPTPGRASLRSRQMGPTSKRRAEPGRSTGKAKVVA